MYLLLIPMGHCPSPHGIYDKCLPYESQIMSPGFFPHTDLSSLSNHSTESRCSFTHLRPPSSSGGRSPLDGFKAPPLPSQLPDPVTQGKLYHTYKQSLWLHLAFLNYVVWTLPIPFVLFIIMTMFPVTDHFRLLQPSDPFKRTWIHSLTLWSAALYF